MTQRTVGVVLVTTGSPHPLTAATVRDYLMRFLGDKHLVGLPFSSLTSRLIAHRRCRHLLRVYREIADHGRSPLLNGLDEMALSLSLSLNRRAKEESAGSAGEAPGNTQQNVMRGELPQAESSAQQAGSTATADISEENPASASSALLTPCDTVLTSAFNYRVYQGCLYGAPFFKDALSAAFAHCSRVLILPLFPQVWNGLLDSVSECVSECVSACHYTGRYAIVRGFSSHPLYRIQVAGQLIRVLRENRVHPDVIVVSFHGLPKTLSGLQERPYVRDCEELYEAVDRLATDHLSSSRLAFQSRMGPLPWTGPYLTEVLDDLAARRQSVAVICPGFMLDCTETLHEVNIRMREHYLSRGGPHFTFVPAPAPEHFSSLCMSLVDSFLQQESSSSAVSQRFLAGFKMTGEI